jgi:hypothetical protein
MVKDLNVIKTTLNFGLEKPVRFLHLTDTHIVRDREKENGRAAVFGTTDEQIEHYFFMALKYARENNLPIVHTGDLVDYITNANLDFLDKHLTDVDYILAPGSHDFCHLIPGAKEYHEWKALGFSEDEAYKSNQIKKLAPYIKNNMCFSSKIIGGVNVVAIDNSYLDISEGQLDALKAEVAKGYPVIIAMHIPIHTKVFDELNLMPRENLCSSADEQKEYAIKNNRPDLAENIRIYSDSTWNTIEYIKSEPIIKLVLAGHRHHNVEATLGTNKHQIVTHANCQGFAREITIL